jgi:hypothetical protein
VTAGQRLSIERMVELGRVSRSGFYRFNANPEMAGDAQFAAILRNLNITSARHLPSLSALKQLVADLEAISDQQVA